MYERAFLFLSLDIFIAFLFETIYASTNLYYNITDIELLHYINKKIQMINYRTIKRKRQY